MISCTPDLQRIAEALKACRERYSVRYVGGAPGFYGVWDRDTGTMVLRGDIDVPQQWIDARCAEAMVRAMREPSAEMERAFYDSCDEHGHVLWRYGYRAMCDAILGETQP